ncbi:MAG: FAD-dependent oxidoreductase, partial [Burkholderiaceae bacterium]|nr:FAD-dependent oxidoreductase [Burkholderiaceae bacterium]
MREACVVGAGVVGITSAWYLAEAGWKVSMVDKADAVATGASFMNGGQLSYRYVSPLADAGVPFKALKWLTEADGPLRFKQRADLAQWTWLAKYL